MSNTLDNDPDQKTQSFSEPTRYTRRNFWIFVFEGSLYGGGLSFVALASVIPGVVRNLGGGDTLVAFLPTMMFLGFCIPQLLTVKWMESLPRYLPVLRITGFFQRIVYLIAFVALWFLPEDQTLIALILVATCPLISGLFGGITITGWMRMTARTVPGKKRSSGTASRNLIAALIGIFAWIFVEQILARESGLRGISIIHGMSFLFLAISYLVFLFTDEPEGVVEPKAASTESSTLSGFKEILRKDQIFRYYIFNRMGAMLVWVLVPFMAVHAIAVTEAGLEFTGRLLAFQMAGNIIGNILGGFLGDKKGSLLVLLVARIVFIVAALCSLLSQTPLGFCIGFACWGVTFAMQMIGEQTFIVEHAFGKKLPTYVAFGASVALVMMFSAGALAALLRSSSDSIWPLGMTALFGVTSSIIILMTRVKDPRFHNPALTNGTTR